jgi:hypothetical protein
MDYVFSRIQIGYDAIVLAYKQPEGQYDTYLLGKNKGQEQFMFRTALTEEKDISALVKKWAKEHLDTEDQLVHFVQCNNVDSYRECKLRLAEKQIVYEVKGKTFFIRQGDLYRA